MYTKEQMLECWMRSATSGGTKIDRDYEKSCFDRWIKTVTLLNKEPQIDNKAQINYK